MQDRSHSGPTLHPLLARPTALAAAITTVLAGSLPCINVPARAGTPRVQTAFPAVAQRGTEQDVVFTGSGLLDARTVLFDAPGFEVTTVKKEANRFTVKIRVPADAELGEHHCRVVTGSGIADLRVFLVSPFPVVQESDPKTPARVAALEAAKQLRAAKIEAARVARLAAEAKPATPPAPPATTPAPTVATAPTPAPAPAVPPSPTAQAPTAQAPTAQAPVAAAPVAAAPVAAAPVQPPVAPAPKPVAPVAPTAPAGSVPQLIELNTTVYGRTQGEDSDTYAVELQKGQRLSVEALGLQLQTQAPYDPEVILRNPSGTVIKTVSGTTFGRGNPVFSLEAPEAGMFTITIRDSTRAGAGDCQYVMHVGDFARPVAAIPSGGPAGKATAFTLLGDAKGPIKVTANPGNTLDSMGGIFPLNEGAAPTPTPVNVRVSNLPNVLESGSQVAAPIQAVGPATPLPAAFNGVLSESKETDYFRFSAKKGTIYELNVRGRVVRSPIDSVIDVFDAKGTRLGGNDDNGSPDSFLRWTAPADAEFILGVHDQLQRGGPLFTYRVEVTQATPRVKMYLPEMVLNNNQDRRAIVVPRGNRFATLVRIKREDFAGAVALDALNLPPNVQADSGPLDKTVDSIPMVFRAEETAPLTERFISMTGTALDLGEAPAPSFQIEHLVNICENGNQKPYYTFKETAFAMAVTDAIPAQIDVVAPSAAALRGGTFPLKIRVTRKPEFKGSLELSLLFAPPGVATGGSVKIPAEANEGTFNLSVNAEAPLKKWKLCVTANADFGKGVTWFSSDLFDFEVAEAPFSGTLVRTSIPQGGTGQIKLKLEQKSEFEGKAHIELLGLPNGVSAQPQEIDSQSKEVLFAITAKPDAALGIQKQVTAQFTIVKNGQQLTANCATGGLIRVDRADPAAAAPAPTAPVAAASKPQTPATPAVAAPAPAPTVAAPAPPAPVAAAPKPQMPATPAVAAPTPAPTVAAPAPPAPVAAASKPQTPATPAVAAPAPTVAAPAPAAQTAPAPAPKPAASVAPEPAKAQPTNAPATSTPITASAPPVTAPSTPAQAAPAPVAK